MDKTGFYYFLDVIGCDLIVKRFSNQDDRWMAHIENCEVKEGCILSGVYGSGKTPALAIEDYIPQISGNVIVINAATDRRKEFNVPK